ncbi:predicted protein [Phaeodactylum tricornutum CCAP 1055/1]|uniref:Uncharacterized protein n=1 Tax=Phaeodactylum tricornutum (strain CCAP 1055/1) TaxID=556484 RepID=B7FVC8_PHATC|nr:predicted protein [Phaeodactylum tricornutum CCAP 1055/1]EEC49813.1 predicted protein [Phaeodactylum tricornutum CCAP 1055/1]|eukprot:XP_002179115.1 predicted protein [Phaeodactylum tricornutum CCAP 1055/1]
MSNWFARLRQKSPSSNSSANGAFPIDPSVPVSPYATDRRYRLPDEAPPSPQPGFERTTSGTAALWRTDTVPFTEPQPKDHLCLPDAGNIINARVDGVSPLTVSNASTIYNAHDNDDDSSSLLFTTIIPQKPRHDDTVVTKPSSGVSPRSAQLSNATSPPRLSSMPGTDQTTPYSPSPPQTMSAATIVSPPSPVVTTHYGAQTTPGIAESRKSFWQEKAFPSGDTYAESPAGSDDSPLFTPPRTDVRTRTAWLEQAFTPSGGGNMESPTKLKPEVRLETQRAPPVNIEPCPMESCPPPTPLSPPQPLSTRKEREPPPEDLSSPGQAPEVLAWRIRDKSKDTHAWAYNIWYRQGLLEWCPPESSVTPTSNSTQNLPPFVASSVHPHRAVVDVPDDQGTLPVKASPLRFRPLLTHKQKENDRPKVSTVSSMGEVESSRTQAKNCSKDPTVGSYQQLRVKVLASKEDVEKPVLIEPVSSDVVITEKVKSETVECEKDSMDIVMNNGIKKQFTAVTTQSPSVSKMSDHPAQYLNTGNDKETVKQNDRPKVSTVSSMGEVESSRTQAKNCSKDPTVGSYQQLRVKVLASKEDVEKPVLIEPVSSDVVITEKVKSETVECEKDSMDIVMNNGIKKQFTAVTTQSPSVSKMSDHPAQYLNTGNIVDVRQENHDSKKDAASFTDTAEDETVSPALIQGLSVSRVEPIQQHQDTQSQDLASMCGNDSQSVGASGLRQEPLTPLEKARRKRSASRAIAGHVRMVTSTRYTSFQKSRRAPILSLFGGPNPVGVDVEKRPSVGVDVEERPSVDSETQSSLPNSKGNQERGEAYQEFVSAYRNYSRDRTSPAHYATRIQALDRLNAAKVKNRVPPLPDA